MRTGVLMWLRALGNFAIGRGLIEVNPCVGIDMPAIETARDRVLSDAELVALWEAASASPHPYGAFILVLILSGQRRSEVAGMVWSEISRHEALGLAGRARQERQRAQHPVERGSLLNPQIDPAHQRL